MKDKQKKTDTNTPIDREEVQRIVSGQIKSYFSSLASKGPEKNAAWWNSQWLISAATVAATALLTWGIAYWQLGKTHDQEDHKRDIKLEVTAQMGGFRPEFNGRIESLTNKIDKQGEDVAKIKGALGIASNVPGTGNQLSLQEFAKMDRSQFSQKVGKLADAIEAAKNGPLDDIATIDAIQKKIAALPLNTPEAIRAAFTTINYASFVREKKGLIPGAAALRSKPCPTAIKIEGPKDRIIGHVSDSRITACQQELDGLSLKNVIIQNAIVMYNGGAVNLENVTFIT
jgi:hypothetical protein